MARDRQIDALLKKLLQTIEASLSAADAARDAVQEILRRGADTGIFFAGSKKGVTVSSELTTQDKEFLRAVSIKPDR
jgi:hypothetical protein